MYKYQSCLLLFNEKTTSNYQLAFYEGEDSFKHHTPQIPKTMNKIFLTLSYFTKYEWVSMWISLSSIPLDNSTDTVNKIREPGRLSDINSLPRNYTIIDQ